MPTPLPVSVSSVLASPVERQHHNLWHLARLNLSPQQRAQLGPEWNAPRLQGQSGSGVDFLQMHRLMIAHVNSLLTKAGDANYPAVSGWTEIPWDHNDPEWPMPPAFPGDSPNETAVIQLCKGQAQTDQMRNLVAMRLRNPEWLRNVSLDRLGIVIEGGIHGWMHIHWSARPWYTRAQGQDENDIRNDYLGRPSSSHVNVVFWKLHGWIDDTIGHWETAGDRVATLSDVWTGPSHGGGHMHGMAPDGPPASIHLSPQLRQIADTAFFKSVAR